MGVMVVNSKEVLEAQGRILERIDTVKENKQKCIYYVQKAYIQKKSVTVKVDEYFFSYGLQKYSVNVPSKYMTKNYILKR